MRQLPTTGRELLPLVSLGYTHAEIALHFRWTERTVARHLQHIRARLADALRSAVS
jgi:DNA-directed RNA polymerase specialized sigma24 family protein